MRKEGSCGPPPTVGTRGVGRRGAVVDRWREKPSCRPGTRACRGKAVNGERSHGPPPVAEDVRRGGGKPWLASGARRPRTLAPGRAEDDRGGENRDREGARAHSIQEKNWYAHN
jgi:hypothetical protein